MKRLLCLVSMMDTGGAETFLMKIYRVIDRSKYQLDFCVNVNRKCHYDEEILAKGGVIYHIPSKTKNMKEFKRQLSNIVREKKYKYVLRITSNGIGFWDLKIAKKAGAEVCIARSSNSSDGGGLFAIIINILGRVLFDKYVDIRIAPSKLAAMYTFGLKNVKLGRVKYLQNGLDLKQFAFSKIARNQVREELNIGNEDILIGHIGRFTNQKNHAFLIEVFYKIYSLNSKYKLVLIGNGELEDRIKNRVEQLGITNVVHFLGIRSDVPDLLSAMDIYAFPSLYEGMPNTVIEAQATALPCIVSDTISREVQITDCVEFVELKDTQKWVDSIMECKIKPRDHLQTGLFNAHYDIHDVTQEFVNLVFGD